MTDDFFGQYNKSTKSKHHPGHLKLHLIQLRSLRLKQCLAPNSSEGLEYIQNTQKGWSTMVFEKAMKGQLKLCLA